MFVCTPQLTVSNMRLLAQLEKLQSVGHLSGTTVNFGSEIETALSPDYRERLIAWGNGSLPPAARFCGSDDIHTRLEAFLTKSIRFHPNVAPDFQPMQALLPRGAGEK